VDQGIAAASCQFLRDEVSGYRAAGLDVYSHVLSDIKAVLVPTNSAREMHDMFYQCPEFTSKLHAAGVT
jgi:hypothetical protein